MVESETFSKKTIYRHFGTQRRKRIKNGDTDEIRKKWTPA